MVFCLILQAAGEGLVGEGVIGEVICCGCQRCVSRDETGLRGNDGGIWGGEPKVR